jgi:hypothetical protein
VGIIETVIGTFLNLLFTWLGLFIAPLRDPNMLWLLVPVYIGWILGEFFQEKHSASAGNAVSNGFIALWAGFDWLRTLITSWRSQLIAVDSHFFSKLFIALFVFSYGIYVMMIGIRVRENVLTLGRIRVVTYVVVMLTPIFYEAAPFAWNTFIAIILFFPLFYFIVEFIDWITPDPKALEDEGEDSPTQETSQAPQQVPIRQQPAPYLYRYYPPMAQQPRKVGK